MFIRHSDSRNTWVLDYSYGFYIHMSCRKELSYTGVKTVYLCYLDDKQGESDEVWNKQCLWLETEVTAVTECRKVSYVPYRNIATMFG